MSIQQSSNYQLLRHKFIIKLLITIERLRYYLGGHRPSETTIYELSYTN